MYLLYELEFRQLANEVLDPELQIASDLISLATSVFQKEGELEYSIGVDETVQHLTAGLLAKATKQYRSIVEMCVMGAGEVADSNCRLLFETLLASHFLLKHRVRLIDHKGVNLNTLGKSLTTKFRTMLYLANDAFTDLRNLKYISTTKGLKRSFRKGELDEIKSKCAWFEKKIGLKWTERLKNTRNYSGLQMPELAKAFGQSETHAIFYKRSCPGVHGANARHYVTVTDNNDITIGIGSDETSVMHSLYHSSTMMANVLSILNLRFGFEIGEPLVEILERIVKMRVEFPKDAFKY